MYEGLDRANTRFNETVAHNRERLKAIPDKISRQVKRRQAFKMKKMIASAVRQEIIAKRNQVTNDTTTTTPQL